jgi:hypothetical protein
VFLLFDKKLYTFSPTMFKIGADNLLGFVLKVRLCRLWKSTLLLKKMFRSKLNNARVTGAATFDVDKYEKPCALYLTKHLLNAPTLGH